MLSTQVECASASLGDVHDIVTNMLRQERTIYKRTDYLSLSLPTKLKGEAIDGSWRQRIIEWMYGVVDHCNLRRDSVAVATFYLDLSASHGLVKSRRDFQLVAMTSLMLSIKLYDSTLVKLDSMVKLGRGLFDEADVIEMEATILHTLKWHVHPPTPVCFMRQLLRLLPPGTSPISRYMIVEVTRFISEISACLYKFVSFAPSSMAFAGILIAMERIDTDTLPLWQRRQFLALVKSMTQLTPETEEVVTAIAELRKSLDNNANLQELLQTIDAQCAAGQSKQQRQRSSSKDESESTASESDSSASGEEDDDEMQIEKADSNVHSPREVVALHSFR